MPYTGIPDLVASHIIKQWLISPNKRPLDQFVLYPKAQKGFIFMQIPRRKALKLITVLSGALAIFVPELSMQANAKTKVDTSNIPWGKLSLKNGKNITNPGLANIRTGLQSHKDVLNSAGGYNLSTAQFQVVRHEIEASSDHFLAAVWQLDSTHVLAYWELNEPVDHIQTQIHLFKVDEASKTFQLIAKNVNTVSTYGTSVVRLQSEACCGQCNQFGCCPDPVTGYPCASSCPQCSSINFQCSFTVCASCYYACKADPVTCAGCLLAFCPLVSFVGCCNFQPGLCCQPQSYCTC